MVWGWDEFPLRHVYPQGVNRLTPVCQTPVRAAAAEDAGTARELRAGSTGMFTAITSAQGFASARRGEAPGHPPGIEQAYTTGRIGKAHIDGIRDGCDKSLDFSGIQTLPAQVAEVVEPGALRQSHRCGQRARELTEPAPRTRADPTPACICPPGCAAWPEAGSLPCAPSPRPGTRQCRAASSP